MPHANNPYTSADPCENCGAKARFVNCDSCRKRGCVDCMILEESPDMDELTGYRDSFYICGECAGINTDAPMLDRAYHADVYDDAEVAF